MSAGFLLAKSGKRSVIHPEQVVYMIISVFGGKCLLLHFHKKIVVFIYSLPVQNHYIPFAADYC